MKAKRSYGPRLPALGVKGGVTIKHRPAYDRLQEMVSACAVNVPDSFRPMPGGDCGYRRRRGSTE